MPQMGESIFEGTITKWLKNVGDTVQRDEPLFEISTDKVDAEIPSPAAGVLTEIKIPAGQTAQINTVVAVIGGAGGARYVCSRSAPAPAAAPAPAVSAPAARLRDAEHVRSSPLVRKIARENNVNLAAVQGTGAGGRVTKEDILAYIEKGPLRSAAALPHRAPAPRPRARRGPDSRRTGSAHPHALHHRAAHGGVEAHQPARPHRLQNRLHPHREDSRKREEQVRAAQRRQAHLHAVHLARGHRYLRKMPIVDASMEGDAIRYHQNINLGIAVALEWGLIVPVIKQAEEKNFLGIARAIADLAERARGKKLKPDEVGSGTFTITNPGIFGEQFGMPIINQPESAILGVGGLFKEPAVVTGEDGTDSIAIRHFLHLTLGFDHRIIDGADAGKFMAEVKKYLKAGTKKSAEEPTEFNEVTLAWNQRGQIVLCNVRLI